MTRQGYSFSRNMEHFQRYVHFSVTSTYVHCKTWRWAQPSIAIIFVGLMHLSLIVRRCSRYIPFASRSRLQPLYRVEQSSNMESSGCFSFGRYSQVASCQHLMHRSRPESVEWAMADRVFSKLTAPKMYAGQWGGYTMGCNLSRCISVMIFRSFPNNLESLVFVWLLALLWRYIGEWLLFIMWKVCIITMA